MEISYIVIPEFYDDLFKTSFVQFSKVLDNN